MRSPRGQRVNHCNGICMYVTRKKLLLWAWAPWYYVTQLMWSKRLARSQWETLLQSNAISHWLGTNLESSLDRIQGGSQVSMPVAVGLVPIWCQDICIHHTYLNAFSWMKVTIISLFFFPNGPVDHTPALVLLMAWCRIGVKPIFNTIWNHWARFFFKYLVRSLNTAALNELIPVALKLWYSERTGSVPWLLMPWLLASPVHQQPW